MALITKQIAEDPVITAARVIVETSKQTFAFMKLGHQRMFNALWNTAGADPQDILNALGEDAAGLFITGSLVVDVILNQDDEALTPEEYMPPRAPTLNEDGTVTLAPAPDPEP